MNLQNDPIVEQDAIELVRQAMKKDGFSDNRIKVCAELLAHAMREMADDSNQQ